MVSMLRRALPALAVAALCACAPSAMAATVSSGNPLTIQGKSDATQNWRFDDSAGNGTVDAYLSGDPVYYGGDNADLPANCTDFDSGQGDASTPGQDTTNDTTGDGVAYILECTEVTSVVANAGDQGSTIDGRGLTATPVSFTGGAGDDTLFGGALGDTLSGGPGYDWVAGNKGNDTVDGGADDNDGEVGGPGNDTVIDGDGSTGWVAGGPGDDTIRAGGGNDYIAGDCGEPCGGGSVNGAGTGTLYADGNDTIDAGAGDDYAEGDGGNDTINGGPGDDGGSDQSFLCGLGGIGGCSGGLYGGSGDDVINGGDGSDVADGGEGNDHVNGDAGNDGDTNLDIGQGILAANFAVPGLTGGPGDDVVTGGSGDDVIENDTGSDTLQGDGGSDTFVEGVFSGSDSSADSIAGGDGVDTFQYWTEPCNSNGAVQDGTFTATLDGVANDSRTFTDGENADDTGNNYDVENVQLVDSLFPIAGCSTVDATLTGNDSANVLASGRGNDTIDPGNGPDTVESGGGDDRINSRDGYPDHVDCGEGTDSVTGDNFDTYVGCENVDSITMKSAYDLPDGTTTPPPVPPILVPADTKGPKTTLSTDTHITSDQLLNGVTLTVGCDEQCAIEGRLLGSQPVGSHASSAAVRGFNVVLGRKHMGYGSGRRKLTIRPCAHTSAKATASCRTRLQNQWKRKKSFTVKVQTTATDKAGNRTRVTKLIKVTVVKHKKAHR